jgi:hypothetical protein
MNGLKMLEELSFWIESKWTEWGKRGVSLWFIEGQTIFRSMEVGTGKSCCPAWVGVGPNNVCVAPWLDEKTFQEFFIKVEFGADTEFDQAKYLIEAAIEKVASR